MKKLLASILAAFAAEEHQNGIRVRAASKVRGAFGNRVRKNPFRGIACGHQPHWSKIRPNGQMAFRHIEGARDTRPVHPTHFRDLSIRRLVDPTIILPTHRDTNPHPVAFLP